jgi:hypothetical protein
MTERGKHPTNRLNEPLENAEICDVGSNLYARVIECATGRE